MEKRKYVKPTLSGEEFLPQNYIAACGDSGTVYKFACDAPEGKLYYYRNYPASGNEPTTTKGSTLLGSFSPCPVQHEAESNSGFYWGFIDYDKDEKMDDNELVIVWRGQYGWEGHATQELDMKNWETAKS